MTTCSDIIVSAYRRSGVLGAVVAPGATQADIGLERLKGIYERMAQGLFGASDPYYLSSGAYTALENQWIYKASGASVITYPATVVDTITGLTRMPMDGAVVRVTDPTTNIPIVKIYNAGLGLWQDVVTLTAISVAPLSGQFEEALKDMLAVMLSDENNLEPTPTLKANAALGKLAIASRYSTIRRSARLVFM